MTLFPADQRPLSGLCLGHLALGNNPPACETRSSDRAGGTMRCLRETLLARPPRYLENVYSIGHKEKLSACHPRPKIWARSRLRIHGRGRKTHHEGISSTRTKRE